MNKFIGHLKTITKHKLLVCKHCFKCGIYKRGLCHDNSKFGPTEFFAGVRNFQGTRSPIDAEKEKYGYSLAWQHHKGHNPHHWEYWIDNLGERKNTPIQIPEEYVIEMICDWLGAGQTYLGDKWNRHEPLSYYNKVRSGRIIHPATEQIILYLLTIIDEQGLESFYIAVRNKSYLRYAEVKINED